MHTNIKVDILRKPTKVTNIHKKRLSKEGVRRKKAPRTYIAWCLQHIYVSSGWPGSGRSGWDVSIYGCSTCLLVATVIMVARRQVVLRGGIRGGSRTGIWSVTGVSSAASSIAPPSTILTEYAVVVIRGRVYSKQEDESKHSLYTEKKLYTPLLYVSKSSRIGTENYQLWDSLIIFVIHRVLMILLEFSVYNPRALFRKSLSIEFLNSAPGVVYGKLWYTVECAMYIESQCAVKFLQKPKKELDFIQKLQVLELKSWPDKTFKVALQRFHCTIINTKEL